MNSPMLSRSIVVACFVVAAPGVARAEPPIWESRSQITLEFVNGDPVEVSFESLGLSFPFGGCTYQHGSSMWISPRGFVTLDGNGERECCDPTPAHLVTDPFPRIAPLWSTAFASAATIGRFDEGGPADSDRIAITWRVGAEPSGRAIAQLELFSSGAIVFGYENLDAGEFAADVLIGLSPGGGSFDPESTDYSAVMPFSSGAQPTVYEFMPSAGRSAFDLSDANLVFEPNGRGGFHVADVECGRGTVNAGAGSIRDVLFVNGSSGLPVSRRVTAAGDAPLVLTLRHPSGPPAHYVLWMWATAGFHPAELRVGDDRIGCLANPSPLNAGEPQPLRCLAGRGVPAAASRNVPRLEGPEFAPLRVTFGGGAPRPTRFIVQGVIQDPGASNTLGFSVTNAVQVDVQ
ncbi:MAG: hypothetical protein HYR85_10055 [Planctomycetes bacterium]|nr:hypothetical protein [Planctomycetota bacterium]MBI3846627.1 hypothetical protein [Planctomycetota bacterium]